MGRLADCDAGPGGWRSPVTALLFAARVCGSLDRRSDARVIDLCCRINHRGRWEGTTGRLRRGGRNDRVDVNDAPASAGTPCLTHYWEHLEVAVSGRGRRALQMGAAPLQ